MLPSKPVRFLNYVNKEGDYMSFKRVALILTIGLMIISFAGCSTESSETPADLEETKEAAATVNDEVISMDRYQSTLDQLIAANEQQGMVFEGEEGEAAMEQVEQQAIDTLINEKVLVQKATDEGFEVGEADIESHLEETRASFSSEEEFEVALEQSGFTLDAYKDMLSRELLINSYLESEIDEATVSEEELTDYYEQYKAQYEAQMEGISEEDLGDQELPPLPDYEEIRGDIEAQIRQQKEQAQISELIQNLVEESDIEIHI